MLTVLGASAKPCRVWATSGDGQPCHFILEPGSSSSCDLPCRVNNWSTPTGTSYSVTPTPCWWHQATAGLPPQCQPFSSSAPATSPPSFPLRRETLPRCWLELQTASKFGQRLSTLQFGLQVGSRNLDKQRLPLNQ